VHLLGDDRVEAFVGISEGGVEEKRTEVEDNGETDNERRRDPRDRVRDRGSGIGEQEL
jgi:hypothetical protein